MVGKRQLRTAELGSAPPRSVLRFDVPAAKGFVANAILECNLKVVSSWESVEIAGKRVEEELIPKGQYTLQISIAYTKTTATSVDIEVGVADTAGAVLAKKTLSFSGRKGDIGRSVGFLTIA